jgi:cell division protein DivIC
MDQQKFMKRLLVILKNKYVLTTLVFFVWVLIFDENNLIEQWQNKRDLKTLQTDKAYYLKRINEDSQRMKELKTNNENLEKFAREQYLMKKKNEDVYVIVKEKDE